MPGVGRPSGPEDALPIIRDASCFARARILLRLHAAALSRIGACFGALADSFT
jgi:hypothetical protein